MNSKEIRKAFIDFFKDKDHKFIRSSPVVPIDDPTLLFTNAGMNQFKSIFLDQKISEFPRAVNSQKCIRVSGKHNDLEEVGIDTFHHTFFEMLGNWSFGDYYKAEAINWAWELFTEVWGLDKNRLWVTVYHEDNEAFDLWPKVTDISPNRVLKFDKKDNFWEMGETGPCGPCSEIHYFIGDDIKSQSPDKVNSSDQYWELWNLVFIQHNRLSNGKLEDLSAMHVDTGAGFERIVSVMQGKLSNYSTDLFLPIIGKIESITGKSFNDDPVPFQVISDHIRMLSFAIADGALPSNDGRGYVLRRILRRAARFGRSLDMNQPFIFNLVGTVEKIMGDTFPEIVDKKSHIEKIIKAEETSFNDTLDRGLSHFNKVISNMTGKTIPGSDAFKLYDTFGFPLDLTQLMAREKGLSIDEDGFKKEMDQQKKRAKSAEKFNTNVSEVSWNELKNIEDSKFKGYEAISLSAEIVKYASTDDSYLVVLDQTPFYAESGGQIGDTGTIKGSGVDLIVQDVQLDGECYVHHCTGTIGKDISTVECRVDFEKRQRTRKNHTATHLMHKALKMVLGDHVQQAGSLVHPDYLRFDLTHFEKISKKEIREIENIVNSEILINNKLDVSIKAFDEAKKEGAVAMFGEKYGDQVRVITVADFSKELCGGTHVDRTGDIGLFKITEETSLASGVRRIVAVTGPKAVEFVQDQVAALDEVKSQLKCNLNSIPDRLGQLIKDNKTLEKELKKQKKSNSSFDTKILLKEALIIENKTIVIEMTDAEDMDSLKDFGNSLLLKLKNGIGVLGAVADKPMLVVVVTDTLIEAGIKAGDLAKQIGSIMGGGGGGRPNLATAGGKDQKSLETAMEKAKDIILKNIEEKNAV
ncbi:MAG: alanine--tRNA ligase [Candidatus Neomarinimicrobiota bacterium]|nr:alanine--tRNA ligase [Candidatus Neomarinimicrobiota bacterium]MED5248640.1 alanine--tRNA ligase [Candidatus Neomarinimicrobiota bacterium]